MTTRAKQRFRQPKLFHAALLSLVSKTFRSALAYPIWRAAEGKHVALLKNNTSDLVSRPPWMLSLAKGFSSISSKLTVPGGIQASLGPSWIHPAP